jgi:hypothetical protein
MTPGVKTVDDLQEDIRILKKYGRNLSKGDLKLIKAEEAQEAAIAEKQRLHHERVASEHEKTVQENIKTAREELGRHLIVTCDGVRLKSLMSDGGVPCSQCGANLGTATGKLIMMAGLIRTCGNLRCLIRGLVGGDLGKPTQGIPCVYTDAICPSCGARVQLLIQMVI